MKIKFENGSSIETIDTIEEPKRGQRAKIYPLDDKDLMNELVNNFDLSIMSNEDLEKQLYNEVLYYSEDLMKLCRLIRKNIPRKMMYRLISKLYRVRIKT